MKENPANRHEHTVDQTARKSGQQRGENSDETKPPLISDAETQAASPRTAPIERSIPAEE